VYNDGIKLQIIMVNMKECFFLHELGKCQGRLKERDWWTN